MIPVDVPKRKSLRKDLYELGVGRSLVIPASRRTRAYLYAKGLGILIMTRLDRATGLVTVWRTK
jgi:hypothetical protein